MPYPSSHRPAKDIDTFLEALRERGANPDKVSYPCTIENHADCTGRVLKPDGTFMRCECLDCNHPKLTAKLAASGT